MDDRFDFQLVTEEFLDGVGLDYIPGSYRAFGNNGSHIFDDFITSGMGASPEVLLALAMASDHLPVVADYHFRSLLVGDYSGNGSIEQGDLDLVILNWGADSVPNEWIGYLPTGRVDQEELDWVLLNWGTSDEVTEAASVPEPGALAACALAALAGGLASVGRSTRSSPGR